MRYFNTSLPKFSEALSNHVDELGQVIYCKVKSYKEGKYKDLLNPYTIDAILKMKPKKLYQLNIFFYKCKMPTFNLRDFEYYLSLAANKRDTIKDGFNEIRTDLNYLFDYKEFCEKENGYSSYKLAKKLDIPTCVYCNRVYTKTVISREKQKVTRPTFDHWFPKSKFPLLQLSFYNLIPSCTICNSGTKGSAVFNLNECFHPYLDREDFDYIFSYDHSDYSKFKFKIKTTNEFSEKSVKAFYLEEIYKTHEDEISDLRAIKDRYSPAYLSSLKTIINGSHTTALTDSEIYRLAFGVYLEEDKFDRRPLSKMKKDILKELGIIS